MNFGRDLPLPEFGDFKLAKASEGCPKCGAALQSARGIEVGHIFELGTKYSEALSCRFLDAQGKSQPVIMGCYGIGISRMAAAWIEQNHDDKGIIWSRQVAPFDVHLIGLNLEDATVSAEAERIYKQLRSDGFQVLFDDRPARAGEKFSDADLIGIPARITISKRALEQQKLEFKWRQEKQAQLLSFEEVLAQLNSPPPAGSGTSRPS